MDVKMGLKMVDFEEVKGHQNCSVACKYRKMRRVCLLLDKMACDGYVKAKNKPRLVSQQFSYLFFLRTRVIQSEMTDKRLVEVKKALGIKLSFRVIQTGTSVGSDLTITRERSVDTHQNKSSRIQDQLRTRSIDCGNPL
ncbi:hypothetical protein MKX03_035357 [Papaver bracteatum]|nr:hypothetical protein MKX03_035357 [Papaver bracteatum]